MDSTTSHCLQSCYTSPLFRLFNSNFRLNAIKNFSSHLLKIPVSALVVISSDTDIVTNQTIYIDDIDLSFHNFKYQ